MKQHSRVAAFRRSGKILGEFSSLEEAARILNIDAEYIEQSIVGKCKCAWAESGPQRNLGTLYFREIDDERQHTQSGRG